MKGLGVFFLLNKSNKGYIEPPHKFAITMEVLQHLNHFVFHVLPIIFDEAKEETIRTLAFGGVTGPNKIFNLYFGKWIFKEHVAGVVKLITKDVRRERDACGGAGVEMRVEVSEYLGSHPFN